MRFLALAVVFLAAAAIVIFVHGGAFMVGNRRQYASVGRALASQGLATAVVSYRLFPQSDALGAVDDVACATAWVMRHADKYGLDPRNVFLVGHSAGAQIVAVIGTNAHYGETPQARAAGIPATTVEERGADHMGMVRALVDPKDPLNAALLYFISKEKVS